jgi:hypothetical protein
MLYRVNAALRYEDHIITEAAPQRVNGQNTDFGVVFADLVIGRVL